jgi:hypothetical protein
MQRSETQHNVTQRDASHRNKKAAQKQRNRTQPNKMKRIATYHNKRKATP